MRSTDPGALFFEKTFTVNVVNTTEPPYDITLSNITVAENKPIGTFVGTLLALDSDPGETFTYTLVSGTGSTDNDSFTVGTDSLLTNVAMNYEAKSSYSIRVRATDGNSMTYEKSFVIAVSDANDPPTNIVLSNSSFAENSASGTFIGKLTSTDPDPGSTFTYSLTGGDSASFKLSQDSLFSAIVPNFESKSSYSVKIRTTDNSSGTFDKTFAITVTNVNETPTNIALTPAIVSENSPIKTVVGRFTTADPDAGGTFTYTWASGSTDSSKFSIGHDTLFTAAVFDFETVPSYSIKVRSTDGGALFFEKTFTINVADAPDLPSDIILSKDTVLDRQAVGTFVGTLSAVDQDPGTDFEFALVSGTGATDNASFLISNDTLYTKAILNYQVKTECSIRVRATDSDNLTYDKALLIHIISAPLITSEPADTIVGEGKNVRFSVVVSGTPSLSYAWYKTGSSTVRGTSATLSLDSVSVSLNTTSYYCIAKNIYGIDTSRTASLTVIALPVIATNPHDTTVVAGSNASFSVTTSAGSGLTYEWLDDEDLVAGTLPALTLTSVSASDSGSTFRCVISNIAGSVTSTPAKLHVLSPPIIMTQPLSDTATDGDTVTFMVTVSGTPPFKFKWYRNGTDLIDSVTTLRLTGVTPDDNGSYYECVVTNSAGDDRSEKAYLTVNAAAPFITVQPVPRTVLEGGTVIFTLRAKGTPPLYYKWYKTGSATVLGSTDSLVLSSIAKSDSGTSYYCVVHNEADSVISTAATLHVGTVPPIINLHPANQTIYEGETATFFVQATGSDTLKYTWYKRGDNTILGTTDTLVLQDVARADSGGMYFCKVTNDAGIDSSDDAMLIVKKALIAPVITLEPVSQTKYVGNSVTFTVTATGNPPPSYQWERDGVPMTGKTGSILTLNGLDLSDDGSEFTCKIYNSQDTISSNVAVLTIEPPPSAEFTADSVTGSVPLTVFFTDSSSGNIDSYNWDFGDGNSSSLKNPEHEYTEPGQYSVKLVVTGPSGVDSTTKADLIFAYSEGDNPVRITAKYLEETNIKVTLTNLTKIDTAMFPPPWVDSLGIWIMQDSLPSDPAGLSRIAVYKRSDFKRDTILDTLTLPATGERFGLMTGLYWNNGTISEFSPANGCLVLLRDTVAPVNLLSIAGTHLGGDSARFSLTNILSIDSAKVDSVGICYSLDSATLSFKGAQAQWFTSEEILSENEDLFSKAIKDIFFDVESKKIWCAVILKGKNDLLSTSVVSSFVTRTSIVENPVILTATAISPSKIVLSWPELTDTSITRIRIWRGKTEIPSGPVNPSDFDSVRVSSSDTTYTQQNLESETWYYFGAQILKNNTWSPITQNARASAKTLKASDTTHFQNFIDLEELVFDTVTSKIMVHWCLDSLVTEGYEIAITYSTAGYPVLPLNPQIINVESVCDSAELKLNSILFDTTYYIALWLRKTDGDLMAPTDSSRKSITTPSFTREIVTFFRTDVSVDTVQAFNGTVVLWKDKTFTISVKTTDTLSAYNFEEGFEGMIPVGTGFYFNKQDPTPAFYIGLHYETIPQGYSPGSIRIYRINDGVPYIEYGSVVDSVAGMVYVKTSDLEFPFLLMIDTAVPELTIKSDTGSIAEIMKDIKDTVTFSDNIGNLSWKYVFGKGDEAPSHEISDILDSKVQKQILVISADDKVINQDNGVRALLIISDGTHTDTFNLSRRVQREKSDQVTTTAKQWFPLSVTADLKYTEPESLIVKLEEDGTGYDNRYMRLFRWINNESGSSDNNWVEYNEPVSSLFNFLPGRMIWLKTLKNKPLDFGPGVTVSLKDDQKIQLSPEDWTDIGLPYQFNIRLADILDATPGADSLSIFEWVKDSVSKQFYTNGVFVPGFPDKQNRNITLDYTSGGGFSIFNASSDTINLSIPPVPVAMSKPRTLSKATNSQEWSVKVISSTSDGASLPEVYCGYSPKSTLNYYPVAPTFLSSRVMIFDRSQNRRFGHYIGKKPDEGLARELVFVNDGSEKVNIRYSLEKTGAFPSDISASVLDPSSGIWEESGNVTVAANSSEYRWLVAADDSYRDSFKSKTINFKYSLLPLYPNPFRNSVHIRFTVPAGAKEKIRFAIHDALGRRVWEKTINGALVSGEHVQLWNGHDSRNKQIQAGTYFLSLTVLDSRGKAIRNFDSRFTYFP